MLARAGNPRFKCTQKCPIQTSPLDWCRISYSRQPAVQKNALAGDCLAITRKRMYEAQNSRLETRKGFLPERAFWGSLPTCDGCPGLSICYCSDAEFSLQHHARSLLPHPCLSLSCGVLLSLIGFEKMQR